MTATFRWLHKQLAGIVALALIATMFLIGKLPEVSAADQDKVASEYSFTPLTIALPAAKKNQAVRTVNKEYAHIEAWISSVGSAIAMNDLDNDGKNNDLCLVDTRTDQVVVTPTPGAGDKRYAPFELEAPSTNPYIAPMGCVPGDFNEDGKIDILAYYWGRTPVLFLKKANATTLDAKAFQPVELVPNPKITNGLYDGDIWNTNSATIGDFDGDGHLDIFIGNYFPEGSRVLDDRVSGGITMNQSMSHAFNGGGKFIFRFVGATAGDTPTAKFDCTEEAIPAGDSRHGWTLASSATDLNGDGLPELYIANDFGADRLLYNISKPGRIDFVNVNGVKGPGDPKSKVIGNDSFKGMGVDFGDLNHDGMFDAFVSNITTSWGIQESNFQWMNNAKDNTELTKDFQKGVAPFSDASGHSGSAWSGWGWDVKIADYNNSGESVITQATGFVKGQVNRWPQLQELATANDGVLSNPFWWPNARLGDDIGGDQTLHFFAKAQNGRYVDIAKKLGLAVPVPTRGIATGDTDDDGLLDFAVSRQFEQPVFYHNNGKSQGSYIGLNLTNENGSPAVGAEVTVTLADGRKYIDRVDGSSGHSGRRTNQVHIGLGDVSGPQQVHLQWRDRAGALHQQDLQLTPGWHSVQLGSVAKEK
ncbi:Repeat domain-containing protein [Amycolatopsis xylanica]|uniref:Repeat domain-containing protein n=1 Tax=Amycolatopsis xylanica TaxID=589385 RepID=A0A1H3D6H7_9PSEU|nr:CRTAC1 family protein [Amycolatopsis xylanica]SDX61985.1 Repeat domain-containing protein [Amycolatopsis xylanica]